MILMVVVLSSCSEIDNSGSSNITRKGNIGFAKVGVGSLFTKSETAKPEYEFKTDEAVFMVSRTEEPLQDLPSTKGAEIKTSTLDRFRVEGFLDPEIKEKGGATQEDRNNLNFIDNKLVVKDGSVWKFQEDQMWRSGIHHYFWAYSPENIAIETSEADFTKAKFSYTSDFDSDVIIANTNRYYGRDDEDESTRANNLKLDFYHALASVTSNLNVTFKVRPTGASGSGRDVVTTDRGELSNFTVRNIMSKGECEITDGLTFNWTEMSESADDADFASGNPRFLLPQDLENIVFQFTVLDKPRQLTRPYVFNAKQLLGDSNWEVGNKYGYNISGSIIFPEVVVPPGGGIDASFTGNKFKNKMLIQQVDVRYISKLRFSWKGVPGGNAGNGTIAYIGLEKEGVTPNEKDYIQANQPVLSNPNMGFCYNHKLDTDGGEPLQKGNYYEGYRDWFWFDFDVPEDWTVADIYALYNGSNNSGTCNWIMNNFTIEVLEWRF